MSDPSDAQTTAEFDYIVIGSGAGGGPLAARLAQEGKKVLVIEAGSNQAALNPTDGPREVTEVPAFHGVSTEHPELSWQFFVKHYTKPPPNPDPSKPSDPKDDGRGIFYPRAAALGGCTIHNAMITIAGPDSDWDDLADFLRDDSWRSETMRAYFERLERNEYAQRLKLPRTGRARFWDNVRWLFGIDRDYSNGGHGFDGWLRTSVADLAIGLKDFQLIKMLKGALVQAERAGIDRFFTLVYHFLRGRIRESLDPNHTRTQALSPEGVALIPLAVGGKNGRPAGRGHRSSPREFLLEVQSTHPDNLVIWTKCFVTELLFEKKPKLRAVGVKYLEGKHLYRAHPEYNPPPSETKSVRVKAGGEVILCGGSFNTPQVLMLSGIGDRKHLEEQGISCHVHSPGVGLNLHDRYEVTVVSKMKHDFTLLKGATFRLPVDESPDPFLQQWRKEGTGLYSSNGSVLGILKRSRPDLDQPDLFIFGIPLSFKGYSVGYSKDPKHNFFTWTILKARTRNQAGTVRLRNADPLETPEINFRYFQEGSEGTTGDEDDDLLALVDGVKFVRGIARHAKLFVEREEHPGKLAPDGDDAKIKDWIRREAWGHHACGSCRMGPPEDENAVLDSRFRVLGEALDGERQRPVIEGLRVVDASIFPKIPGYFIVANIYMASEKAADVILEDAQFAKEGAVAPDNAAYPRELREKETQLVRKRREEVSKDSSHPNLFREEPLATGDTWSGDVAGLALSGGGIRSATFNLGVIQGLAKSHCLRRFDFLSTVSGGGYIGCFLGRFFDRLRGEPFSVGQRESVHPPADRVEDELAAHDSLEIGWLRKHGKYIAPSGAGDARFNAGVILRNFLSIHFVVGALIFALFGVANAVRYGFFDKVLAVKGLVIQKGDLPIGHLIEAGLGVFWSPWFVLFELIVLFLVLPRLIGYWMASQEEHERYQRPTLRLVFILIAALLFLGLQNGLAWEPVFLAFSLLTAFVAVELAWRRGRKREQALGTGSVETQRLRTRNYLTMDLGLALALGGIALAFALIDTAGHSLQQLMAAKNSNYAAAFAKLGALLVALIPVVRVTANFFVKEKTSGRRGPSFVDLLKKEALAGILAVVLFSVPLIFYSFAAHAVYNGGSSVRIGVAATILALVVSWILSRREALPFVNRSSLAETYAARLARAYLGASNPLRHHPTGANIDEVMAGDDVSSIRNYRPYETGGPLHLINLTVNQTVDFTSQRGNRDRKGEAMAVSCLGVSVGKKWHSAWDEPLTEKTTNSPTKPTLRTKDIGRPPGTEHPLVDAAGDPAQCAENLPLRKWMSISGAAIGPGRGQTTKLGTALLFGLANLRTGYWWDSGISDVARDGFPVLSFFRRLLYLLPPLFVTQSSLIFEWIARYPGPWERFWYLSDGGFFENLGLYELVRRRVPRMLVCDAGADPIYQFEELGDLVRKVRIDFNARIVPLKQAEITALGGVPDSIGTFDQLKPSTDLDGNVTALSSKSGALFWVHYDTPPYQSSLLLYLKAKLTGDETPDVRNYYATHPEFPHESTGDQFFEEEQWESYRKLGEQLASDLFSDPSWFWRVPLQANPAALKPRGTS